jgi:hypothetical protein
MIYRLIQQFIDDDPAWGGYVEILAALPDNY